jgi:hypothetical protein
MTVTTPANSVNDVAPDEDKPEHTDFLGGSTPIPTVTTTTRATNDRPPSRDAILVVADRASHLRPLPRSPGEVAKRRRRAATATKNCVALSDTVAQMADLRTPCRSGEARQCRFERAVLPGAAGGRCRASVDLARD